MIVIGAGHAGCEAALAAARMGCSVLLLTIDLDKIAAMPCSPSIGGMAKGQLVRELDALGGEMGRITDLSAISYKVLNTKKGPAVHSSRTQNDKNRYHRAMKSAVEHQENLELKQAMVEDLVIENGRVAGVRDQIGGFWGAGAVVIATGTFLGGLVHIGGHAIQAGRAGEFAACGLAESLKKAGFRLGRMKTGTPPRIHRRSIDFGAFDRQDPHPGDRIPFSHRTHAPPLPWQPSYMGHTNEETHRLVRENIRHSALYSGAITGVSARYCPSFEDKIMKFPDRPRHNVILEPEGIDTDEIYASGLGNSLPLEIQTRLVRSVRGLEEAEIMRPAYAIEYEYINPVGLKPTLETRHVRGLYMAGQINGTSGYEEAAAQGMWAGINAARKIQGRPPFLPDRSRAYMAVMVDDLVTRGTREPYRMFTSRAEYRLLLREDNADFRLMAMGNELGLIPDEVRKEMEDRKRAVSEEIRRVRNTVIRPSSRTNAFLAASGSSPLNTGTPLARLVSRAELNYEKVIPLAPPAHPLPSAVTRQVEINIKYEGYIQRQKREVARFRDMEKIRIPPDMAYEDIHGLSNELKAKLTEVLPASIGQASRIDGMTPAALSVLMVFLKARTPGSPRKIRDGGPVSSA